MKFRLNPRRAGTSDPTGFRDAAAGGWRKGRVFLFLFGIPFFAMGALFFWMGALQPILNVVESRSWPEVPCTITSSEVKRSRGSDGDTYRIDITFTYRHEGRDYTGGSYNFSDFSSSGHDGKAEVIRQYPVGLETICWVSPHDPNVAVLSRDLPGIVYLIAPFTSVFMLVGAGLMLGAAGALPQRWRAVFQNRHTRVSQTSQGDSQLKPSTGPIGKLIAAIVISAFWNGIVGVFVWLVIDSFREGDPEWFLVFFLVPFVAIGLGMIGAIVYFALALANPRLHLSLSEGSPRLGEVVRLRWRFSGSVQRLDSLEIRLEGKEAATYRAGTRSVTDRSLFCRETVFQTDRPSEHLHGEADLLVPAGMMHSFSAGNNEIEWTLKVSGSIRRWPDVNDSYPIAVRPLKVTE